MVFTLFFLNTSYAENNINHHKFVSVDKPLYSDSDIQQWALNVAIKSFTYNYQNITPHLQDLSHLFTVKGWNRYLMALKNSGNMEAVASRRLNVSAAYSHLPIIIQKGLLNGAYTWQVSVPLQVKYSSARSNMLQPIQVHLVISRTAENPDGIGVKQYIAMASGTKNL